MKTNFSRKVYVKYISSFIVTFGCAEHMSEVMTNCKVLIRDKEQAIKLILLLPTNKSA